MNTLFRLYDPKIAEKCKNNGRRIIQELTNRLTAHGIPVGTITMLITHNREIK